MKVLCVVSLWAVLCSLGNCEDDQTIALVRSINCQKDLLFKTLYSFFYTGPEFFIFHFLFFFLSFFFFLSSQQNVQKFKGSDGLKKDLPSPSCTVTVKYLQLTQELPVTYLLFSILLFYFNIPTLKTKFTDCSVRK